MAEDLPILVRLFAQVDEDPAIRVLVFHAQGRHFSAGYDMSGLLESTERREKERYLNPFEPLVNALEAVKKPVVAVLQGGVYGGAIDLALACDFRLGTRACEMFMPALRIGLRYYVSGIERYVSELGLRNARRIFLTGATFGCDEMKQMGFLDEVYADEWALWDAAKELATQLAQTAPLATASTKRLLREAAGGRVDHRAARAEEATCFASADMREGLEAMKGKRAPQFTGS